ncbi:MAG: acyl-CoA dehydrogenase family protein [Acidimicrobiia bacterium]
MDFEFSAEQEALRDSVRKFLADRAPLTHVREMLDDDRGTTDAVWRGLADLGATGLLVPEAHGGTGMGMVDAAVVLEELGRAVNPGPYASSAIGAVSLVLLAGTDDDYQALLPALASGDRIGTVALYEPDRRNEWRTTHTTATADGDNWRVDGRKVHVPDAMAADVLLVTATKPESALGVFVVEHAATGVTITPTPTVDGSRKQGEVTLEGAVAHRLGGADAVEALGTTLDRLHAGAVVDGVGAAAQALEISVEYAKERKQFGVPIGSFQAVQHLCTDMLRAVELARAAGYYACWAADAADTDERHRAATMALAFAADELYGVGASAVQVHAGIGYTWEHDIGLFYKRLLTLQQTGGGTVDQLEELASIALA